MTFWWNFLTRLVLVAFRSNDGWDTEYVHSGFESRLKIFEDASCEYGGSGVKFRVVRVEADAAAFDAAILPSTGECLFPAGMAATRTVWYC